MSLIDQYAEGAPMIRDWLGDDGTPVARDVAEGRASVCVTCPENRAPKWWESAVGAIADTIRKHLSVKHQLNITVSSEELIHMCRVCGCCLRLKVHMPIKHIAENISDSTREKFPPHCWIPKELNEFYQR